MTAHGPRAEHRIVLLHGKDSFLRLEWTRRLREALEEKHGAVDEFTFDGTTAQLAVVLDELRSYGLMASHKLVTLDSADAFFAVEERRRAMERYADAPMKEATLLLRTQNWRPGNFDKLVAKVGIALKCEAPGPAEAVKWCIGRSEKQHRVPIDSAAAAILVDMVGTDLARLDSELGKLAVAVGVSGRAAIDRGTVIDLVGASREEQAWEIQEAILTGIPRETAAKVVDLLRVSRAPEVMISWSAIDLARKIHAAACLAQSGASDGQISKELRLWGASTGVILSRARRLGVARAAASLHAAIQGDFRMKSGSAPDSERALVGICVELAGSMSDK